MYCIIEGVFHISPGECSDWESCLKTTQQKLSEMENEVLTTSTLLSERSKELNQLKSEKLEQGRLLDQLRTSLEDQREESTELISKVTAQSADIVKLQNANVELQSKINMAELLTQQVCRVCSQLVVSQISKGDYYLQVPQATAV